MDKSVSWPYSVSKSVTMTTVLWTVVVSCVWTTVAVTVDVLLYV